MSDKTRTSKSPFDFSVDFESIFGEVFGKPKSKLFGAMNIFIEGSDRIIEICLPGALKRDIKVSVKDNLLIVDVNTQKPQRKYISEEIGIGPIRREVKLGQGYGEEISSTFDGGMLKIVLKHKPTKEKTVEIC